MELPCKIIGMSNDEYRAHPADSRTFLHSVSKYGGEAQKWMDEGGSIFTGNSGTTKGSEFDTIVTGVLEGKSFDDMVTVIPENVLGANGAKNTKAYKEWAADKTGVLVTADQKAVYAVMLKNMREAAGWLMDATTETQASVFWEMNECMLKCRPDAGTDSIWWDLKTTSSHWDRLFRSAIDYGYAEQEWLYVEGAKAIGMNHFRMPFVFVQTFPPYSCRVMRLPVDLVEAAGVRMQNTMEAVRLRRSTGMYLPADHGVITEMQVPQWALRGEELITL